MNNSNKVKLKQNRINTPKFFEFAITLTFRVDVETHREEIDYKEAYDLALDELDRASKKSGVRSQISGSLPVIENK